MRPLGDLRSRLRPFLDGGLLDVVATRSQIRQGELAMWPWVISTDVTDEAPYQGALLGHPVLRQPVLLAHIGLDHLAIGTGLRAARDAVVAHLHFTHHRGMPVWDLQVLQTHPGGLDALEARSEALLGGADPEARRARRALRLVLPDAASYHARFLGPDGWIARARALDYPTAADEGSAVPQRFFALTSFLSWAARVFPSRLRSLPPQRIPLHLAALATERLRTGRSLGWWRR